MAELSEFQSVAPEVTTIGELTKAQIDAQFAAMPAEPVPSVQQDASKVSTLALFSDLTSGYSVKKSLEVKGGSAVLANLHGMSRVQVENQCAEVEAMYALYLT